MEIVSNTLRASLILIAAMAITACGDKVMQHKKGRYTINTTTIGANAMGYNGPTPLLIHIRDDKVEGIEALKNNETPSYFDAVQEELLGSWNGLTVDEALNAEVDAVSGSTYSSEAVIHNVKVALEYYQKHR